MEKRPKIKVYRTTEGTIFELAFLVLAVIVWVLVILLLKNAPDVIATHFDGNGRPNGDMNRGGSNNRASHARPQDNGRQMRQQSSGRSERMQGTAQRAASSPTRAASAPRSSSGSHSRSGGGSHGGGSHGGGSSHGSSHGGGSHGGGSHRR